MLQGSLCCKTRAAGVFVLNISAARVFVLHDLCCKGLCAAQHDLLGNKAVLLWGVTVAIYIHDHKS